MGRSLQILSGEGDSLLSARLVEWYAAHRRDLPWRQTADPYRIWLSEVILQQTRVAQGTGYYERFTVRFPDVPSLASASQDEVLRLWQGLGYYSRARNLQVAARQIVERHGGVFPRTYEQVRALPGIGDYTAAAICSIAYGLPYATVDGNVYRVLARLFDVGLPIDSVEGRRYFAALARELLDERQPGLHNQALMEFGALQCTARSPRCAECPLADRCLALARGRVGELPVKAGRTAVRERWFHYLDLRCGERTLLQRREGRDIWQGLWEYPLIETPSALDFEHLCALDAFLALIGPGGYTVEQRVAMPGHQLSHQLIHAVFYRIRLDCFPPLADNAVQAEARNLDDYPVSRLTELYREQCGIIPAGRGK